MSSDNKTSGGVPPLPDGVWIMRLPVISTAHVEQATMNLLSHDNDFDLKVIPYPEGAIISIPTCWTDDGDPDEIDPDDADNGLPTELAACLRWAGSHGFYWLRLDSDGDVIEGLRTFDW